MEAGEREWACGRQAVSGDAWLADALVSRDASIVDSDSLAALFARFRPRVFSGLTTPLCLLGSRTVGRRRPQPLWPAKARNFSGGDEVRPRTACTRFVVERRPAARVARSKRP